MSLVFLQKIKVGYPGLQFFAYATMSCFNPYVAVILTDRGLDNTRIGLVLTANALVTIIAQPFWGMVSDRIRSIQKVFMICLGTGSLIYLLMPLVRTLPVLMLIFPAITFFLSPIVPLLDTWTYQAAKNQSGQSYGKIRLWGSIGYAAVIVLIGRIISLTSIHATSFGFALMCLFSILVSLSLKPLPPEGSLNILVRKGKLGLGRLFHNYYYVTFVLILGLMFLAVQPMFGFLPRLMLAVGGDREIYSWVMALSAIVEIPIFIGSRYLLARFRPVRLLIASMIFFIFRLFFYSVADSPGTLILIGLMHGLSYALFLTGMVSYIDELTPAGLKSTALTLASAIYCGLSGIIGNAAAGRLMDRISIQPVYRIGARIVLSVLILFVLSLLVGRRLFRSGNLDHDGHAGGE